MPGRAYRSGTARRIDVQELRWQEDHAGAGSGRRRGAVASRRRRGRARRSRSMHRPRYDDWSLPKGKVDPGETEPVTAVREICEETGFRAQLGRRLTSVGYPGGAGRQEGRVLGGARRRRRIHPQPRGRQTALAVRRRRDEKLSIPTTGRCCAGSPDNRPTPSTVLIVRHGTAGRKSRYKGDDRKRPLDKHGRAQAESLVGLLLAFGASDLHAASRVRCHQTIEPLAEELAVRSAMSRR